VAKWPTAGAGTQPALSHLYQSTELVCRAGSLQEGIDMATKPGTSKLLLAAAVVAFVLAALGVAIGDLNLIAIGLALGFGSFLV